MNKLLSALVFFLLLLVPVSQDIFATHETPPTLDCPAGSRVGDMSPRACIADNISREGAGNPTCLCNAASSHPDCVHSGDLQPDGVCVRTSGLEYIAGTETLDPPITISEQCADNAVLDPVTNHCVPDFPNICSDGTVQAGITCIAQAIGMMVGGELLEIDTVSLLVAAIGVNPVINPALLITLDCCLANPQIGATLFRRS